jgi:hypothetical protein
MQLKPPFMISSRLLPGLKVADGSLSLEALRRNREGRIVYRWYADIPAGEFSEKDLKSGSGADVDYQNVFGDFLSFLSAAAESYAYGLRMQGDFGENVDLFPRPVVEWAHKHSEEIDTLQLEIEDSEEALIA